MMNGSPSSLALQQNFASHQFRLFLHLSAHSLLTIPRECGIQFYAQKWALHRIPRSRKRRRRA